MDEASLSSATTRITVEIPMFAKIHQMTAAFFVAGAVAAGPMASVGAQTTVGDGLINVAVGDVNILNNVDIGVAAQVAANICGVKVGSVAVLGTAVDKGGGTRTVCTTNQGPVTLQQN
jgi:hypothetical protein